MIWGAMCFEGLSDLVIVEQNQNSTVFANMLAQAIIGFAEETIEDSFIFKLYNAVSHFS